MLFWFSWWRLDVSVRKVFGFGVWSMGRGKRMGMGMGMWIRMGMGRGMCGRDGDGSKSYESFLHMSCQISTALI